MDSWALEKVRGDANGPSTAESSRHKAPNGSISPQFAAKSGDISRFGAVSRASGAVAGRDRSPRRGAPAVAAAVREAAGGAAAQLGRRRALGGAAGGADLKGPRAAGGAAGAARELPELREGEPEFGYRLRSGLKIHGDPTEFQKSQ